MKFLIIVPTLNSYLLLGKLIHSLNNQTFKNWRVLFVDGDSNKEHKEWIKKLCKENIKFSMTKENKKNPGIFGAMNEGFINAKDDEWILFWGSDDWFYNKNSLKELNINLKNLLIKNFELDISICNAIYFNAFKNKKGRISNFGRNNEKITILNGEKFRKMLFCGFSPAHQGTIFGPNLKSKIFKYNPKFELAADLEYFLKLSRYKTLKVGLININLVYMGNNGVSSRNTLKKFKEVSLAYFNEFKFLFIFVFLMRYLRKIKSLIYSYL